MSSQGPKPRASSLLAQVLKDHREQYNLTQEQLASDLSVDVRTLRRWESRETILTDIRELKRLADKLGIEPERFGLAASLHATRTPEQIEEVITHIWSLVEQSRIQEARNTIERLIHNLQTQITTEDPKLLYSLARAFHTAGYAVAEGTRASGSYEALLHYQQMESIARIINDHTLLNIALTYQGDMYRRLGNITKAIEYLEAARDTTPHADTAARGNGIQLLGRAYFYKRDIAGFERVMAKAEALSSTFDPATSSTMGHYSLGTVYEEYGRSYTTLGQIQKAMEYLNRAEAALPSTKFWQLLVMTARTMVLVKSGEIRSGVQLAIEAANECRATGNLRYLERIYAVQQYLDGLKREIEQISTPLRETLDEGHSTEL